MIATNDVVLKMRSRLGDKDSNDYKYSDAELIDNINSALIQLSSKLYHSTRTEIIKTECYKQRYKLPHNHIKTISINVEKSVAIIKSFEWMQNNKNNIDNDNFYVCMDEQSFFLYPQELIEEDMQVEINYNYLQKIQDIEEQIEISPLAEDALLFYSLHMSYQVTTSDKNDTRSIKYLNLFKEQVKSLKEIFARNKHSKNLRSKYRRF